MKCSLGLCFVFLLGFCSFGCSDDSGSSGPPPSPPDPGLAWTATAKASEIEILAGVEDLLEISAVDPSADQSVEVSVSLADGTAGIELNPTTCTLSVARKRSRGYFF